MINYLLTCRSLTYAQKISRNLESFGMHASVIKTPGEIITKGCGYCVKVSGSRIHDALRILRTANLSPNKVFIAKDGEKYREMFI